MTQASVESSEKQCVVEGLLQALADVFSYRGEVREVAVLADAEGVLHWWGYDSWTEITSYRLNLVISRQLYSQIQGFREELEESILKQAEEVFGADGTEVLRAVKIGPRITDHDANWRERAKASLIGEGITNQGRVFSLNIASKTCDGLLFRSNPEILLYKALKSAGVAFAPLPVFIRGGQSFKRIEPDFIVVKDGVLMHIEVDGDTVHTELPAEAQERADMLESEGAFVYRIKASDCDTPESAKASAARVLSVLAKRKSLR